MDEFGILVRVDQVFAIIAFIVIGLLAIFGVIPIAGYTHAPLFGNYSADGWLPNGVLPIFSTLLTVVFAFSGTEVVGVAAERRKIRRGRFRRPYIRRCCVWRFSSSARLR